MMSKDDKGIVTIVYRRFLESESDLEWTDLDEKLYVLDWLTDQEIINESTLKYLDHSKEGVIFRCKQNHIPAHCFAPQILDSIEIILILYKETKELHEKNRYVLAFYLAMSSIGLIYAE